MIPAGSPVLLDTSIVIHLARGGTASERLESRFGLLSRPLTPWISAVTVGELLAFALRNGWGPRKLDALKQLIANLVVVNINREQVLQAYAVLDTHLKQSGISIGQNDLWIAATAASMGAVLLTADRDFDALDPTHLRREWVDPQTLR